MENSACGVHEQLTGNSRRISNNIVIWTYWLLTVEMCCCFVLLACIADLHDTVLGVGVVNQNVSHLLEFSKLPD